MEGGFRVDDSCLRERHLARKPCSRRPQRLACIAFVPAGVVQVHRASWLWHFAQVAALCPTPPGQSAGGRSCAPVCRARTPTPGRAGRQRPHPAACWPLGSWPHDGACPSRQRGAAACLQQQPDGPAQPLLAVRSRARPPLHFPNTLAPPARLTAFAVAGRRRLAAWLRAKPTGAWTA